MDIRVLHRLFHDKGKVGGFRTVAIRVFAVIFKFLKSTVKSGLYKPDIFADPWQIGELQGSSILFNYIHDWNIVKQQFVITYFKFFLRELEGLFNQLSVALHLYKAENMVL